MPGSRATSATRAASATPAGTTGNPKGVLYEHRSTMLHAMAEVAPDCFDLSAARGGAADRADVPRQRLGPALGGADGRAASWSVGRLSTRRRCASCSTRRRSPIRPACRPSGWHDRAYRATGDELGDLKHVTIGGSAAPRAMIEWFLRRGIRGRPCLGHDRDLADRHGRRAARQLGRAERRGAGRSSSRKQGRVAVRGRAAHRRRRGQRAAARRQSARAACRSAGPGSSSAISRTKRTRPSDGQLVRHRRRRRHPPRRHDADHRPLEGRDQVGRRVDQLDRAGKCRGRLPRRRRSGGDRHPASQMGRAAAAAGRPQGGQRTSARTRSASISPTMSPNGGCPTRSSSSTSCPTPRPASSQEGRCASNYRDYRFADARRRWSGATIWEQSRAGRWPRPARIPYLRRQIPHLFEGIATPWPPSTASS